MERPGRYSSVAILEGFELRGHIHVNRVLLIKQANRYVDCDDFGARPETQNFIKVLAQNQATFYVILDGHMCDDPASRTAINSRNTSQRRLRRLNVNHPVHET